MKVRLTTSVEKTARTEPIPMEMSMLIGKNNVAQKQNINVVPETSTV